MELSEQRLIDLETRLAYQEDLLLSLNDIVSRQQLQMDRLDAQIALMVDQLQKLTLQTDLPEGGAPEIPPHY